MESRVVRAPGPRRRFVKYTAGQRLSISAKGFWEAPFRGGPWRWSAKNTSRRGASRRTREWWFCVKRTFLARDTAEKPNRSTENGHKRATYERRPRQNGAPGLPREPGRGPRRSPVAPSLTTAGVRGGPRLDLEKNRENTS